MTRFPGLAAAIALSATPALGATAPQTARALAANGAPRAAEPAAEIRLEEARRFAYAPVAKEGSREIRLANGIAFDTREGEPPIPAALRATEVGDEPIAMLVQLQAPVRSEWLAELERAGARVEAYVPNYAFLVRVDVDRLVALRSLPFVQWVGLHHPAYRLSNAPDMALRSGRGRYQALLFSDGNVASAADAVRSLGGVVEDTSNGANKIVRFELDRDDLETLARHPDVHWIEPREVFTISNDQAQWVDQTGILNDRKIWTQGIDGTGQVVMLGDSGIRTSHDQFRDPLVTITTYGDYPTHRKVIAYKKAASANDILFGDPLGASYHGTHTSCTFAGNDQGLGASARDGLAKGAKIYFLDAGGDATTIITPGDLHDYFGPGYAGNAGGAARVCSNSWGSNTAGAYTITSMTADQFAYENPDFLICFSNGNAGAANTVGSPASAKNVISVGGTQNGASSNLIYSGTSRGPTDDNRFKPTICCPGQGVFSANGAGDTGYVSLTGTSMASPNLAGSATLVRQYFTDGWYPTGAPVGANAMTPSAALLRAAIVNSGTDNFAAFTMPDNNIGWGRVLLDDALFFPGDARRTLVLDVADGVATGEAREFEVHVTDATQPLEITLVWTDPASTPSAAINLVNDLDLVVEEGATTYLGNVWSAGQSATGGTADSRNVEENFRRATPVAGAYVIRVEGANVPFGPQAFALYVTGGIGGWAGVVFLDAAAYAPGESVAIRVEDADGGASVSVDAVSASEPLGETLVIAGSNGVYETSLPLSLVTAVTGDGQLSVSHGDALTSSYSDASPVHVASASATVDSDDPEIRDVAADPAGTTATVSWTTNTFATSQIEYGTTAGLGPLSTLDADLVTAHAHEVTGLTPETTYFFDVLSADHEGNLVRDDFGGAHYRFTTGKPADVLLVQSDPNTTDNEHRYGDAFASTGWTFNEWGKSQADFPLVGDSNNGLRSYKAVWWQVGWEKYPQFESEQRDSITAVHNGGARIAFVSHDVAWAFSDVGSGYWSAVKQAWFNNIMHATYQADPATWSTAFGVAADPISGGFVAGVPYTPFRDGGAGDEVDKIDGAGTAAYVWRDNDVSADDVAVRWESSGPLGTAGVGVWGGQKTRTVSMFFEWLQMNATTENDATRATILDETIQWLIGGDHPDATIVSPNGGATYTTSPVSISWTAAADAGSGRSIASVRLEYSDDGGMSWNLITASAGSSPFSWDISALSTGATYRVRAIATDNGSPVLAGEDASDASFTIAIPGNENRGPLVIAGSPGTAPSPITKPDPATLTAIVTDALTGNSTVVAAEWSAGGAPAPAGTGNPMSGPFGTVEVAVSAALTTPTLPSGATTIWVRGQDAAGNWGAAAALAVQVNGGTTGTPDAGASIAFALAQSVPNPSNGSASIAFALPAASAVQLRIFDVAGRHVRTVAEGVRPAGRHVATWDGAGADGKPVASGVYFYRLVAGSQRAERKLVLLR